MTQYERVRALLRADWTCGSEMLAARIPRYSARIAEIREREPVYTILRRPCSNPLHGHQAGQMFQWCMIRKDGA